MINPLTSLTARPVTRRWFLGGFSAATVAVGLSACGSSSSTSTSSSSSASGSASTAATATATGAAAAGSVAALAQAFHATLDDNQKKTVLLDYSFDDAKRWSNLPQGLLTGGFGGGTGGSGGPGGPDDGSGGPTGAPPSGMTGAPGGTGSGPGSSQSRVGLSIGDLDDTQLAAFEAMIQAATGSGSGTGYDEITQHLDADDYLAANGGGDEYGRANFYIAILGSPQDSGTWELQFGGHHLAIANTYTDGTLAGATPSFRGIEPNGEFENDGRTDQPMAVKEAALTAMLNGLSADALTSAELPDVYSDLVLGPGNDWAFPDTKGGVQIGTLTEADKQRVLAAIATYVDDIADSDAQTILAGYEAELNDTYIAFSGTTSLTELNDYVRIDGPGVWIEFSMQKGIVLSGNHPHSVWRDHVTDYGGTGS